MWDAGDHLPGGSGSRVVEDGVTGALRESIDELAEAVETVRSCNPEGCRARVEQLFSRPTRWLPGTKRSSPTRLPSL